MTKIFADLLTLANDGGAGGVALASGLDQARAAFAEAEGTYATADAAYRDGLLGDEKALAKLAAGRTAAEMHRDRAAALVQRLTRRSAEAAAAEAEEDRRAAYQQALAARDAAAARLVAEYPGLVAHLLDLVRELAEAGIAVEAANRDLPAGADPLIDAERIARTIPGLAREVVTDIELDLWSPEAGGDPIPEDEQHRVIAQGGDKGYSSTKTGTGQSFFRKRRFRRVAFRREVAPAYMSALASGLALPPLREGDPLAWSPEHPIASSPRGVLARIGGIEAAAMQDRAPAARPIEIVHEPVARRAEPSRPAEWSSDRMAGS